MLTTTRGNETKNTTTADPHDHYPPTPPTPTATQPEQERQRPEQGSIQPTSTPTETMTARTATRPRALQPLQPEQLPHQHAPQLLQPQGTQPQRRRSALRKPRLLHTLHALQPSRTANVGGPGRADGHTGDEDAGRSRGVRNNPQCSSSSSHLTCSGSPVDGHRPGARPEVGRVSCGGDYDPNHPPA